MSVRKNFVFDEEVAGHLEELAKENYQLEGANTDRAQAILDEGNNDCLKEAFGALYNLRDFDNLLIFPLLIIS